MATLQEFRNRTVGWVSQMIGEREGYDELKHDLPRCVPLYGYILTHAREGTEETAFTRTLIYFADQDGMVWEFELGADTLDFDHEQTADRIASYLGISPGELKATSSKITEHGRVETIGRLGSRGQVDWEYAATEANYWWRFLYVDEAVFARLHTARRLSVVAESGGTEGEGGWRIVAPQPVRVKDAPFDFDLGAATIRFVRGHRNSVEYATPEGIRVIDNRQRPIGMAYGEGEEGTPIISRQEALGRLINKFWRGSAAPRGIGEQEWKLRDFVGRALRALIQSPQHLCHCGELIAQGIEVLCGKSYFPAEEIFGALQVQDLLHGTAISNQNYQRRMLLTDEAWEFDEGDRPDPRYVVVHD